MKIWLNIFLLKTRADVNRDAFGRKMRVRYSLSKTNANIFRDFKLNTRYVERPSRRFPPNCSINGMGHTSEQCKVFSDYAKIIRLLCQINKVDMKMIEKFKKSLLWC